MMCVKMLDSCAEYWHLLTLTICTVASLQIACYICAASSTDNSYCLFPPPTLWDAAACLTVVQHHGGSE